MGPVFDPGYFLVTIERQVIVVLRHALLVAVVVESIEGLVLGAEGRVTVHHVHGYGFVAVAAQYFLLFQRDRHHKLRSLLRCSPILLMLWSILLRLRIGIAVLVAVSERIV